MTQMNLLSQVPTSIRRNDAAGNPYAVAAVVAAGALAAAALLNRHLAKTAEHDNPPTGKFLEVDGVRIPNLLFYLLLRRLDGSCQRNVVRLQVGYSALQIAHRLGVLLEEAVAGGFRRTLIQVAAYHIGE